MVVGSYTSRKHSRTPIHSALTTHTLGFENATHTATAASRGKWVPSGRAPKPTSQRISTASSRLSPKKLNNNQAGASQAESRPAKHDQVPQIPQRQHYNTEQEYFDARWSSLLDKVGDVSAIHAAEGVEHCKTIKHDRLRSQFIHICCDSQWEDENVMDDDNDNVDAETDSNDDAERSFLNYNFEDRGDHFSDCDTEASIVGVDTDASTTIDDEWAFLNTGFIDDHDVQTGVATPSDDEVND
jgi:hypothetical protein